MRLLILLFTILVLFTTQSLQQQRRARLQVIRNLNDDNEFVQRVEETPPIRPLKRRPAARPISNRPVTNSRSREIAPAQAPKPKVEKRLFNVLLRTANGFDETAGYSING